MTLFPYVQACSANQVAASPLSSFLHHIHQNSEFHRFRLQYFTYISAKQLTVLLKCAGICYVVVLLCLCILL